MNATKRAGVEVQRGQDDAPVRERPNKRDDTRDGEHPAKEDRDALCRGARVDEHEDAQDGAGDAPEDGPPL